MYNYFMSVQSEPGGNSTYFDFDEHSLWNTVIGQDGTFVREKEALCIPMLSCCAAATAAAATMLVRPQSYRAQARGHWMPPCRLSYLTFTN